MPSVIEALEVGHHQKMVKVNALVDEKITPLVTALNEFESVITLDSCQGYGDRMAYVYFTCAGDSRDILEFTSELSKSLGSCLNYRADEYRLRVEWAAGSETPLAKLLVQPDRINNLAETLINLAKTDHRNRSGGDNLHIRLDS